MSIFHDLNNAYDACVAHAKNNGNKILPISSVFMNAHIECVINNKSELVHAFVIDKDDLQTITPASPDAYSRTADLSPFPLFDKLKYVAKDYTEHTGDKKGGFSIYINFLKKWSSEKTSPSYLKSIYNYLVKGALISDLIEKEVLFADSEGILLKKYNGKEKPPIFKTVIGNQQDAVVRFSFMDENGEIFNISEDENLYRSLYKKLCRGMEKGLCTITGKTTPICSKHPRNIRYPGDSAKLISGQGTNSNPSKMPQSDIGYEASQRIHNALIYLMQYCSYGIDDMRYITFSTKNIDAVKPWDSSYLFCESCGMEEHRNISGSTVKEERTYHALIARAARKHIQMSAKKDRIVTACFAAATSGRLSVTYYESSTPSVYYSHLKDWHNKVFFGGQFHFSDNTVISYYGSPSIISINNFLFYGGRGNDILKGKARNFLRLISCVLDDYDVSDIASKLCSRWLDAKFDNDFKKDSFMAVACAAKNCCLKNDSN